MRQVQENISITPTSQISGSILRGATLTLPQSLTVVEKGTALDIKKLEKTFPFQKADFHQQEIEEQAEGPEEETGMRGVDHSRQ